ncbi:MULTISPECIES: MFS transporter [Nocardiopsidaceae]|uniref:MFS transporter n=1 Tax=Streptomonospora nanhaiensis TaxID=1323731 RepID=A0ABY6YP08_9ACTN|nr:MFS transporter [Streptomonospora nanhaiensis]WAE74114.1 MFS transporter [Streptomonospora nanhaiensis]
MTTARTGENPEGQRHEPRPPVPSDQGRPAAPPPPPSSPARGWAAVAAVAAATFTAVTSEMLPVGLLTPMGDSLGVTGGTAGLTLTITGLVAAASAPFVPAAVARADRRTALVGFLLLLCAANLVSALAPDFAVMVAARVLMGVGMGGVWALAAPLAPRLVPGGSVGAATTVIFAGIAVASVLGVPVGAFVGALAGWRAAFAAFAGLALLVAVALALLLPALPPEGAARPGGAAGLFRDPRVVTAFLVTGLLVTGHFAAYTYVRPVLADAAGLGAGLIGTMLLVYGVAGVLGNFAAGPRAARAPRATVAVIAALLAGSVLLVPLLGGGAMAAGALVAVWGLAYGGVSVSVQSWLMASAQGERETASGVFVGVFNASIALGAFAGGRVLDAAGTAPVTWLAGALVLGALVVALAGRAPSNPR